MDDVKELYAEVAHFRGKTMSISKVGHEKLERVIEKRVNMDNVERLARVLSSNCCENYFSCLIKYSQGKRLNYGQTDTWSVIQDLVVGMKSESDFTLKVLLELGGVETATRQRLIKQLSKHKAQQRASKEQLDNQIRRRMAHKVKLARMEKEDDKKSAHKTDKLPPTDDCKTTKAENSTKRRGKCGNCHDFGHDIRDCPEPIVQEEKKMKRAKGVVSKQQMLKLFND
jgi:hypothetical protein